MPLNERKIVEILLEETNKIEERCSGYRVAVVEALSDIISNERRHRLSASNIQQQVSDKCSATGQFLAKGLSDSGDGQP
jgi:hypothetical protein